MARRRDPREKKVRQAPSLKPIVDLWGPSLWALAGGPRAMGALLLASTCAPRELIDTSFAIGRAKDLTQHHVLHLHATVYKKSDGRRTTETSHPTATTSTTSSCCHAPSGVLPRPFKTLVSLIWSLETRVAGRHPSPIHRMGTNDPGLSHASGLLSRPGHLQT